MVRPVLCVSLLVALLASHTAFAQQPTLAVKARFDLTPDADGFTGRLELLEDARITPALDKRMWQSGGPDMALDPSDPLLTQLAASPLQAAVLRLRDARGTVVAEKKLKREQARLEAHQLHPGHRSIFVTTDLSAGFGSYSGPFTEILDLTEGALNSVQARNSGTHATELISLAETLKRDWKIVSSAPGSAGSKDILEVSCHPKSWGADSNEFLIFYVRYRWNGSEWLVAESNSPGMWESDEGFPALSKFPPVAGYARR
jgi:hypothetical protein